MVMSHLCLHRAMFLGRANFSITFAWLHLKCVIEHSIWSKNCSNCSNSNGSGIQQIKKILVFLKAIHQEMDSLSSPKMNFKKLPCCCSIWIASNKCRNHWRKCSCVVWQTRKWPCQKKCAECDGKGCRVCAVICQLVSISRVLSKSFAKASS